MTTPNAWQASFTRRWHCFLLQNQVDNGKNMRPAGASHLFGQPNRNGSSEDHVMAAKALPSPEVLRQLLRYEPDTGKLFWLPRGPEWFEGSKQSADSRCRAWNSRRAGTEAFTAVNQGYYFGSVFKRMVLAHRVAWAIQTGEWPQNDIDHINGVRGDNRLVNLRAATRSENLYNKGIGKKNKSGFKGVSWCEFTKKWRATIVLRKKQISLGRFVRAEDASQAYARASADFHGKFGRAS